MHIRYSWSRPLFLSQPTVSLLYFIGTVRTLRLILNSYLLFLAGQEELAFPLLTTKHFSWNQYPVVSRLLIKSALPVLQSFGFRAPLYHHFWLTLSTLVTMSFFAIPRCNFECTGKWNNNLALIQSITARLFYNLKKLVNAGTLARASHIYCRPECIPEENVRKHKTLFFFASFLPSQVTLVYTPSCTIRA